MDDDDKLLLGETAAACESESSTLIWPENSQSVPLFFQLATQWRRSEGRICGLIYSEAIALMKVFEVSDKRNCMESLMIMEAAALEVINAQ